MQCRRVLTRLIAATKRCEIGIVDLTPEVQSAIRSYHAVVTLESTTIAHGLPYRANLQFAPSFEAAVRLGEAVPATAAVANWRFRAGLCSEELKNLAQNPGIITKHPPRPFPLRLRTN